MELLANISDKPIYYINIQNDREWFINLASENWIALTIGDYVDIAFMNEVVSKCLEKNVGYCCSTGELANLTEDLFDAYIIAKGLKEEAKTGTEYDHNNSPMTVANKDLIEGFWYAIIAYDDDKELNQIVCVDFTQNGVKEILIDLASKFKSGWLPPENETETETETSEK